MPCPHNSIAACTDCQLVTALAQVSSLEVELDRLRERVTTIADEAFGPFPVQSAEESLTAIEAGVFKSRQDHEALRAQLTAAESRLAEGKSGVARDLVMTWHAGGERALLKALEALAAPLMAPALAAPLLGTGTMKEGE